MSLPLKYPVLFNKDEHRYFTPEGKELISASTLVHLYSPPFDKDGTIIARCAEKRGITVEELRKEWDKTRDDACDRGNNLHSEAEFWVKKKKIKKGDYSDVVKQIAELPFKGKLHSETMVAAPDFKLAGTVDLLDQYEPTTCHCLDFKTNRELKTKSFYTRGQGYSYMLYPVSHLMNCNFIHYSLQLEIYSILLEQNGYKINEKTLIYIPPETRKIELHPIQPLKEEAWSLINHFNF